MDEEKEIKINWNWVTRDHEINPEKVTDLSLIGDKAGDWLVITYEE